MPFVPVRPDTPPNHRWWGAVGGPALVVALSLALFAAPSAAQRQGSIGGRVVDQDGAAIAHASVLVVGTNIASMSNQEGRFFIRGLEVGGEVRLRVTVIGHASETLTARVGDMNLEIELRVSAINLDGLVVTGVATGTQVKRTIGNSISEISVEQTLDVIPVMDVGSLINGRAPGVIVTSGSGQAGSGPTISIRGRSSFSLTGQPLIYVDGIRLDNAINTDLGVAGSTGIISRLNDINPEHIESIEIIKGSAAATLYGTEAANGVIQIITKKGRVGDAEISVRMRQGVNWFMNAADRFEPNWGFDPVTGEPYGMDIFQLEEERGNPPIFEQGHLQGYTASIRGGNEYVRYFVSGDLDQDDGIEPDNKLTRVATRANITIVPSEKFDMTVGFGFQNGRTDLSWEANGGGRMWTTLFSDPTSRDDPDFRGFRSYPPEIVTQAGYAWQDLERSQLSFSFNHRPTAWLSHRLTFGQDRVGEDNEWLSEKMVDPVAQYFGAYRQLGFKYRQTRDVATVTFDYSATANYAVSSSVSTATTVGAQYYHKYEELAYSEGEIFPVPGVTVVDAAALTYGGEDYIENNTLGMFVQEQIGFNDRIFITGALRGDDNSAFGKNYDFVLYPKASASWVVSEGDFSAVPWVSALKLRTAYGQSGQQPETFAALRMFSPVTGGGGVSVVTPQSVGNADLGPEVSREFEVGFDAGLWDNRVGVDFTYYNTHTFDAILLRDVPPSTGFPGSQFVNAGEIKNQGIELQLTALALRSRDVQVDLSLNLSKNANEVVDLGGVDQGQGSISAGYYRHVPGFPVLGFFYHHVVSAELEGTGPYARATNVMCDGGDPNGKKLPDGTPLETGGPAVPCYEAPRLYLGTPFPTFQGSFGASVTLFGNLQLYGLLDWKTGQTKWDEGKRSRCQAAYSCRENYFPEEYDPAVIAQVQSYGALVDFVINEASFAKLREVSATFTLPDRWAAGLGASRTSITLAGRNLATFTSWPSLDPEAGWQSPSGHAGMEMAHVPNLASIVTTISVTF